ncbi:MAG: MltA domain-containing protein [Elusimicrobia bacterium]|nr:MltA domain-containing protein [Elusimicrobiota bacterium]
MISALLTLLLSSAAAAPIDSPKANQQPPAAAVSTPTVTAPALRLVAEADYPYFEESFKSKAGLIKAARKAIKYLETLPPGKTLRVADRDYGPAQLVDTAKAVIDIAQKAKTAEEFDAKVRETFDVFQSAGLDGAGRVVFSSYYQPVLRASLKKTAAYPYPLYRRPKDMVEVDLAAFGKANGESSWLGRLTKDGKVVPYFTREDIDRRKALAGKGLEIAWLKDRFDALDLHIQGSAILKFPDGKEKLAKYAATNARSYNSVGLTLVKAGVFARDEITHDKLREYLHKNPDAESWILASNPRYVFFELAPLPEDGEPYGAAEQPLVPARAIAVDPASMPLGGLYFFSTTSPQTDKDGRLLAMAANTRFAFGLDTGGAIKSPGRVDIYAGHGPQAAATARGQWADGKLYLLVKKLPPRER